MNLHGWFFWLLLLIGVFFFCWLIFGGRRNNHKFIGISPLAPSSRLDNVPVPNVSHTSVDAAPLEIVTHHVPPQPPQEIEPCVDYTPQVPPFPTTIQYTTVPAPPPSVPTVPRGAQTSDISTVPRGAQTSDISTVPRGTKWVSESLACQIMEEIYGVAFERNVRPAWLTNPETGYALELDCYHEGLKIAMEYQGKQHYVYPNAFHRSYDEFIRQVRRDQYKIDACDRHGVYLITVPYNIQHNMMKDYIRYYMPEAVMARQSTCLPNMPAVAQ